MRLFIGIRIPEEIKKKIEESIASELKKKVREARIVPSENQHLTLKFIGDTSESNIPVIEKIISSLVDNLLPVKATVKGAGVFPDERNIRVFWVGMDSGGQLKKLNEVLETKLEEAGICRKENRFKEHITIARFKSTPKLNFIREIIDKYRDVEFGMVEIKEVELIKSTLYPSGPIYTTIFKTGRK